jgi:HEPN domain-containing protein
LTTNYHRTKEWFELALNNLNRVIRNFEFRDYADCVFRIQLTIEQLQKSLLFLLGLQFRKTHFVSKILENIDDYENLNLEEDVSKQIKEIAELSKILEEENTKTRYGIIEDNKLITPEETYNKDKTIEFLIVLNKIIEKVVTLLEPLSELENLNSNLKKNSQKIKEFIKKRT